MNSEARRAALIEEQRHAKKMVRVGMLAAFCGGGGLALWLLQRIFSGLTSSDSTNAIIDTISMMMIGYMAVIIATYILRRAWVLKVDMVMKFILMPFILMKLFTDFSQ